ncbi:hypothetical protein AVEN_181411-1 [Araneus ventricosus]|uniref:Uncharacterized protein n=1 Tax=Araneus ventricosus TaxID=182803 RepID=A0A4Y2RYM6_ARAVE|nr:hypothetical protein AVEN_181411-1 [Araneus ventricosus]
MFYWANGVGEIQRSDLDLELKIPLGYGLLNCSLPRLIYANCQPWISGDDVSLSADKLQRCGEEGRLHFLYSTAAYSRNNEQINLLPSRLCEKNRFWSVAGFFVFRDVFLRVDGGHIYKPYPDRTGAGNHSISLAIRSSDVVFSSRTKRTAIITKHESSYFSSPFSHS